MNDTNACDHCGMRKCLDFEDTARLEYDNEWNPMDKIEETIDECRSQHKYLDLYYDKMNI